jgi:hypothetical protein
MNSRWPYSEVVVATGARRRPMSAKGRRSAAPLSAIGSSPVFLMLFGLD